MAKKTVLAIGIEPSLVDFSAFPGLTTELVTSYIKAQIEKLRAMGYEADSCLIDLGDTAEAVAAAALGAKHYDCVVIGANTRLEIWDTAAWETYLAAQEDSFAEAAEEVLPGIL